MSSKTTQPTKRIRFAIYTRYSSEMQNEISLEAQEDLCRKAIAERGGVVVAVFSDGAKSGWSLERDGFQQLRTAAAHGKFDAVMFWKFDRLARNHEHAVMIKMLLRHEYKLKLYCVEGFSEDEDDSPYSAMMEQMLAVFSAFYSRNLSTETKRGKRHRAMQGEFNGSIAPLGYILITKKMATDTMPAGLYIEPRAAALVRRAFILYATGDYSDPDIADWLNARPYIQKLRQGRQPIGKEMVRDMLHNKVYTGRVSYAETLYSGGLGEGKKSSRGRKEWFEGKHQGFISDELFEQAQQARKHLTKVRRSPSVLNTYVLHGRVFCARCISEKPTELNDKNFGKMRPAYRDRYGTSRYRCLARDRGYSKCEQPQVDVNFIDEQVVYALTHLNIPMDYRDRIEMAVKSRVENEAALGRMREIEEIVQRVDFSWEQGFLSPHEYVEKRKQLQRELETLRPIDYDELIEAADLLENFKTYWDQCEQFEEPNEARQQLVQKIVDRVYVYDEQVIAIALHGDFGVFLDDAETVAPPEVVEGIAAAINGKRASSETRTQSGSDGIRTRDLHLDRVAC